ncbi:deoxyribodipyrimidine photo-lyase [uncultured Paraglaciecola sp.]|uniref:deoxyribodipyrimidine photo-lyase n=1 Tax=uncultured Paraglaciecola sp. TaxID=1765024 RepID=UPI00262BAD69|nr:deoxyribodipyrimidine photo-lyase [uncultured Paraglaciecola sp.]
MLLWFRNDLRTHDNPALQYVLERLVGSDSGRAIFFISEKQWRQHDWSEIKIDFIIKHAKKLATELASLGITLELVKVDYFSDQLAYLDEYCERLHIKEVVANSELEYNEQQRDKELAKKGIKLTLFEADVIVPKGEVLNQSGSMFRVFTPFKRAWLKYVNQFGFKYISKENLPEFSALETNKKHALNQGLSKAWLFADDFERDQLPLFLRSKLPDYSNNRDFPGMAGTSEISPYLAAGLISPRYVLMQLINHYPDLLMATDSNNFAWLNEIIWREFYRHLMFHYPKLCKHQCFNSKYQQLHWHNDQQKFAAWQQAKTGYPLVDAAMRQLSQTGWMHNRLRMVVASFLTKHILIDWRWGEKYFMSQLIDGDLAANNGGWQWAASTGCDAQPYFRIFNPIRQSERFDATGDFIRTYLPELAEVPDKHIHFPHQYIANNNLNIYWPAIVEHKQARLQAIAFYK